VQSDDRLVSATSILFPLGGVRLSTAVTFAVFVTLAIARADRRPLLAAFAWLLGFEAAFQATALVVGHPFPLGRSESVFFLVLGTIVVVWTRRRGTRVYWPPLVAAGVLWVIWVATGFHTNFHTTHPAAFDPFAEVLNEVAKTLWAIAYLVPLLRSDASDVHVSAARMAPCATVSDDPPDG
jgi:hypothetical protein